MKKIITIIIIILALGGAIFLGYSALTNKPTPSSSSKSGPASTILPYGSSLDFQALGDFNKTNRFFPYPKVTPPEIGTANSALVP